jgi:hypothetical protein
MTNNKIMTYINNPKHASSPNIYLSIFFAIIMMLSSYLMKDSYTFQTTFILLSIWLIPFLWLANKNKK